MAKIYIGQLKCLKWEFLDDTIILVLICFAM